MNICLSPRERLQRNGQFKGIYPDSECHNEQYTESHRSKRKNAERIQEMKDALRRRPK